MSQLKNRLQALSLLDRAFSAVTDSELEALIASLPDDHRTAIDEICEAPEGGFTDPTARVTSVRALAAGGRLNGALEQISTVLSDPCLHQCIELLGSASENPSEDEFLATVPTLTEAHGVAAVRLMMASSIAGEAAASVMLTRLLKSHETLAVPAAVAAPVVVAPAQVADEETKARRKAAKEKKQAEARARREQQARAKNR